MNKCENTRILTRNFTKFFAYISLLSLFFGVFAPSAQAAKLFIESETKEIKVGEQFEASFFIDTENEYINAIESKVTFPEKILELKEIRDGDSIINFWIEQPKKGEDGKINFSGIIPGGYKNKNGKGHITSLLFKAKKEGSGSINISDASVLKNDGLGTATKIKILNSEFKVLKSESQIPDSKFKIPIDTASPESFKPEIAQSPDIFDGKWFIVFTTQDKISGIDRYEIREGILGKFVPAQSPYLLQNQKLNQEISIKAIDKEGNERVEIIYPQNWTAWYENYWIIGIIALGVILAFLLRKILWRKFIK